MTRENKLALIIGFSLILVVAILLADHLSPAQQSEMNALDSMFADSPSIALPSSQTDRAQSDPIESNRSPRRTIMDLDEMSRGHQEPEGWPPNSNRPIGHEEPTDRDLVMGRPLPGGDRDTSSGQAAIHVVRKNETLFGIAKLYYGDGSLHEALATANSDRILANGGLRTGTTLFIPSREALIGRAPGNVPSTGDSTTRPAAYRQYTIRQDDRLWDIAKKFLKKGYRYPEIVKLNRGIIKNPDVLPVGKTIRIPNQ